jgi:hypothetical protein
MPHATAVSVGLRRLSRDSRVDALRGIALIMIFIDHLPSNPLSLVTLHSFGFCDAAELFVLPAPPITNRNCQIGERHTSPLIWPTLHKAFGFLLLLVILTIIEEAVVGLFHHRSIAASLSDLVGARLDETLAGYLIMLLVLIPYFAFRVLDEALGEGRLVRMFFVEREPVKPK